MSLEIGFKAFAVWTALLAFAIANGAFRSAVLTPVLGTTPGLIVSGLILCGGILAAAYVSLPWLGTRSPSHLILVGLGWLVLTLVFEFSFGLLRGMALSEVLSAYTFSQGNLWPVVLAVTAMAPWLAAKLRGWF